MKRVCVVVAVLVGLVSSATARHRPNRPKPRDAAFLSKTNLWYLLHVPEGYDPRDKYPLIVVAPYRDDYAADSFKVWGELAKQDRVFLAALNFPPTVREGREKRYLDLVAEVMRKYGSIDRKRLVFVGIESGAAQVLKFVAMYPRVFALGLAVGPKGLPNLTEVKPSLKPRLQAAPTDVWVVYDPKQPTIQDALTKARQQFRRLRLSVRVKPAPAVGLGKLSEEEQDTAFKLIRSQYSSGKRTEVASRLRRAADEAKRKRDEEKKKLLAARAEEKKKAEEAEGPSTPAGKKAEESGDPDEVLVAAQSAYDEKRYAKAVRLYQKLAKLAPDSEYSRLADARIKELEGDPAVKRSMADAESERRARPFLTLA
ncbi:hypothetical protein HQ576_13060, partial [bacterium]|nr:hypothetical protein [bacterium]